MDASSSGARWRRWAAEPGAGVVGASGPEAGSRVLEGGSVANARPVLLLACRVGLSHKLEDEDVVQVGGCCCLCCCCASSPAQPCTSHQLPRATRRQLQLPHPLCCRPPPHLRCRAARGSTCTTQTTSLSSAKRCAHTRPPGLPQPHICACQRCLKMRTAPLQPAVKMLVCAPGMRLPDPCVPPAPPTAGFLPLPVWGERLRGLLWRL